MKYTKKMMLVPVNQSGGSGGGGENVPLPDESDREDDGVESANDDNQMPKDTNNYGERGSVGVGDGKGSKGNSIRKYAADRQRKMLTIVLKLANSKGYDDMGMMKTLDGELLDIVPLLIYTLSPGRNIVGLHDFVNVLLQAGVKPEEVINSHVRDMLARKASAERPVYRARRTERVGKGPPPPPPPPPLHGPFQNNNNNNGSSGSKNDESLRDELMDERTKRVFEDVDKSSGDDDDGDDDTDKNNQENHVRDGAIEINANKRHAAAGRSGDDEKKSGKVDVSPWDAKDSDDDL